MKSIVHHFVKGFPQAEHFAVMDAFVSWDFYESHMNLDIFDVDLRKVNVAINLIAIWINPLVIL